MTYSTAHPSSARESQGSIELVTRERPVGWWIDSTHYHGRNVVRCRIIAGLTCTPRVVTYLPPSTLEHLSDLEEALQRFREPIVLGDLYVDLKETRSLLIQHVSNLLAKYGLIDLVRHFRQ